MERGEKVVAVAKPPLERRRRAPRKLELSLLENELMLVPGIGPRYMEKLKAKGILGVAHLKQLYLDKFADYGAEKMVEYLQSDVGIHFKHHAARITDFVKSTVEEEQSKSTEAAGRQRLTFCVEGNISVGKSTFLQTIAQQTAQLQELVEIVPEPIDKWQDIGKDHFNILEAFYKEPQRFAYTFQNYVFVTRMMQEKDSRGGKKPLRLMERSVFSDRMVFVRAVHEAKWMSEMELSIYDSWFDPFVASLPGLVPDAFIYLRAEPAICQQRLNRRSRTEEGTVSLDYLMDLHEKHEQWLFHTNAGKQTLIRGDWPGGGIPVPKQIEGEVYCLAGDNLHHSIREVPTLCVDYNQNIDLLRDDAAKNLYAEKLGSFFNLVKEIKSHSHKAPGNPFLAGSGQQLDPRDLLSADGVTPLRRHMASIGG
eukprot:SM000048S16587  [mRNA]  locus=s48:664225:666559:+ [translate_table: standard]